MNFMKPYVPHTYALLRIITGLLFLCHGTQKLFGWPVPIPPEFSPPAFVVYGAGGIEFIGGLLVAIGLFTRPAAFLCSGLMAAAYWMAHGYKAFYPMANGGEPAVIYCFIFLFISAYGPGIWSVDGSRGES